MQYSWARIRRRVLKAFLHRYRSQLQENAEANSIERTRYGTTSLKSHMLNCLNVIKSITKDTTSGLDKVVYSDLKTMAENKEMLNDLLEAINSTLNEGSIPFDWQDCNLSVLPKPDKDHRVLKGYRVITMVNILVKLCEKIASKRVTNQLEREGKLPRQVGGARPMCSTTSNVEALHVVNHMQAGLQDKRHFALGLYDLEDAYNRVHIPTLAEKMEKLGISKMLVLWILSMLDRHCRMKFGSWTSELFEVTCSSGLPQGSPLSCILFNIYMADIIDWTKDDYTEPFSYVDDIIISRESRSPVTTAENLQVASDRIEKNQMKIQPDKVRWMLVSLSHLHSEHFSLIYGGKHI